MIPPMTATNTTRTETKNSRPKSGSGAQLAFDVPNVFTSNPLGHISATKPELPVQFLGGEEEKDNRISGTYRMYRKFDPHRPYQQSH
jgi:hypothetical protein